MRVNLIRSLLLLVAGVLLWVLGSGPLKVVFAILAILGAVLVVRDVMALAKRADDSDPR